MIRDPADHQDSKGIDFIYTIVLYIYLYLYLLEGFSRAI